MERSAPAAAASPAPEQASVWEDFLDIFYAPSAVFARREKGSYWIPLLVVSLITGVLFFVSAGVWDTISNAETQRAMARAVANGRISAEAAEQFGGRGDAANAVGRVAAFFIPGLIILGTAFALWLAGKVVGAKQAWHAALVVAAYSYVPRILEAVLVGVQGFFLAPEQLDGRYRVSFGPGRVLDPDTTSPLLIALVGRLDLFTIWVTVLLAIGLAVTGRVDRGQAALAAALAWVLGALPTVIPALIT